MPSVRDIRRRIKSVKSTAQITRAMQMVAASRMRKAQNAATAGEPYAQLINEVLVQLAAHGGTSRHPLMETREVRRKGVVLVSTDRGLCGALNGNLFREALAYKPENTFFVAVGRKAAQFLHRTRRFLIAEFTYLDPPQFADARTISRFVQDIFLEGEVDDVDILYNDFVSTMVQTVTAFNFLPVGQITEHSASMHGARDHAPLSVPETAPCIETEVEFLYEPNALEVFEALLPHSLNFHMYHILLEARASEHSARMVAMKTATDNAQELIKDLTLEYNKMRQAAITTELLEITAAAMAADS